MGERAGSAFYVLVSYTPMRKEEIMNFIWQEIIHKTEFIVLG
jgi:hypothetical protein